jgi:nitrate/TMAO reductase-like tetraheme cytochrome c subunit
MKIRFKRFLFSLIFALLVAGATLIVAQAQSPQPTQTLQQNQPITTLTNDNCIACHKDIAEAWMTGPHGRAGTDPIFSEAWSAQGNPGACLVCHSTGYDPTNGASEASSVACTACHTPIPADHPTEKMPIDATPDLCGKCHSDPRFVTEDWQLSAHYQRGMSCSVCHDAHTAGMKTVEGDTSTGADASALCENCHKDAMKNFPTSTHAEAGVTCVNCHLGFNIGYQPDVTDYITAHKAPDHSFMPTLVTCNTCHVNQMHAPGQAVAAAAIKIEEAGGTPTPNPTPVATPIPPVTQQAAPVSPLGFSGLAGLLGLACGMVLSPWLERVYHRMNKDGRKK